MQAHNMFDWLRLFCLMQLTLVTVQLTALGILWMLPDVGFLWQTLDNVLNVHCIFAPQLHNMMHWSCELLNGLTSGDTFSGTLGRSWTLPDLYPWRVWTLLTLLRHKLHWVDNKQDALRHTLVQHLISVIQCRCFIGVQSCSL